MNFMADLSSQIAGSVACMISGLASEDRVRLEVDAVDPHLSI
jgi:hypothetical protein